MKTTGKSKYSGQHGLFIALAILVGLILIVGNGMIHHRFATLGYLALSVISPVLVLLICRPASVEQSRCGINRAC